MKLPKRLIFTASSGRRGTKHLSRILGLLPGVASLHEPAPDFSAEMRAAQEDHSIAKAFLLEKKIQAISQISHEYYAEVTSMWCKGLLEAWLEAASLPVPDLVILDREPRKVALSLFRLELTPERTNNGREWYMGPSSPTAILKVADFSAWSDYQLCYWYALEIEARKVVLGNLAASKGARVFRTDIEKLSTPTGVLALVRALDLPRPGLAQIKDFFWLLRRRTNTQGSEKWENAFPDSQLAEWEAEVSFGILRRARAWT